MQWYHYKYIFKTTYLIPKIFTTKSVNFKLASFKVKGAVGFVQELQLSREILFSAKTVSGITLVFSKTIPRSSLHARSIL